MELNFSLGKEDRHNVKLLVYRFFKWNKAKIIVFIDEEILSEHIVGLKGDIIEFKVGEKEIHDISIEITSRFLSFKLKYEIYVDGELYLKN
ncbi:MAG: hypothetical protein ACW981_13040 [Candidatus Hodarchaeales archaeon]|jgi:hypothetical protein